jgi:hypothetical protein
MINLNAWRRILFVGIGLLILVTLILVLFVIPNIRVNVSPDAKHIAIIGTLVVAGIHLIFVATFIYSVMFSFKKGHYKNGFLVATGIMLILLSLMILDGAFAYISEPSMHSSGISLFICVGLDFIAGLLSFVARYFRGHLSVALPPCDY